MIITGMDHFQSVCKRKMVDWYNKSDNPHKRIKAGAIRHKDLQLSRSEQSAHNRSVQGSSPWRSILQKGVSLDGINRKKKTIC